MEFTYQTKIGEAEVAIHELNYLVYKNGASFLVKGFASDSAWSKRAGEIASALNSFEFN